MLSKLHPLLACALACACLALTGCKQASSEPAHETPKAAAPQPAATESSRGASQLPPGHPPMPQHLSPATDAPKAPDAPPMVGGLTWNSQPPLERQQPSNAMRAAQYRVAGQAGAADAELTVFYFGAGQGGSVEENLARWIAQFQQPDGSASQDAAEVATRKLASQLEVTTLDVSGNFLGMTMPGQQPTAAKRGHRCLGAIVTGPEGPVFFKLVGPEPTVTHAAEAFGQLVDSVRAAQPH